MMMPVKICKMSYSEMPSNVTAEEDIDQTLQKKHYENTHQPYQ